MYLSDRIILQIRKQSMYPCKGLKEWKRKRKEDKAALRCSESVSCAMSMDACGLELCMWSWMEPAELGKCGGVLEKAPSAWLTYIASLLLMSRRYKFLTNWCAFLCQASHPHWFLPFNMRSVSAGVIDNTAAVYPWRT